MNSFFLENITVINEVFILLNLIIKMIGSISYETNQVD